MLCRRKKQHVRFLWPTPKPLIKTLQLHHIKTSNHPSIFWAVHVIWDRAFVGTQYPELTIVPPIEGWGEKKKSHNAVSFTFTLMSVTRCPSPRRFFFFFLLSFQKLADPRLVGSFTRMTSSAQTLPTVLNKARACFSVWVPLLHWDCYERCEWEDVCSK